MKKRIVITAVLVSLTAACAVFAMQKKKKKHCDSDKGYCSCPMHGMMMKCMMKKEMVPASDGGIIVMAGNRLMKYDSDLELVKETEIKMDMDKIEAKMKGMMKNCPMTGKRGYDDNDDNDD